MHDVDNIKFGLIFLLKNGMVKSENGDYNDLHFVGFIESPSQHDRDELWKEVMFGDEFNLASEYGEDNVVMEDATEEMMVFYREVIRKIDADNMSNLTDLDNISMN